MEQVVSPNKYLGRTVKSFVFQSNLNCIYSLEILLKEMKREFNFAPQTYHAILISVNEAISNAIIHGNKFNLHKKVSLIIHMKYSQWICFTIKDEGCGFDYESIANQAEFVNESKPYGRGIYLMEKFANLAFFSEKGTAVDLYFQLHTNESYFT